MEGHRARKLTTRLVAAGLAVAIVCLVTGAALAIARPESELAPLGLRAMGEGLGAGHPGAWLSLGALVLIVTPCLRLAGLLAVFQAEGERRALFACGALILLLLVGVGNALA